jgi:hypothetical protein
MVLSIPGLHVQKLLLPRMLCPISTIIFLVIGRRCAYHYLHIPLGMDSQPFRYIRVVITCVKARGIPWSEGDT